MQLQKTIKPVHQLSTENLNGYMYAQDLNRAKYKIMRMLRIVYIFIYISTCTYIYRNNILIFTHIQNEFYIRCGALWRMDKEEGGDNDTNDDTACAGLLNQTNSTKFCTRFYYTAYITHIHI